MYHFIYKTISKSSKKFYIGRHSTHDLNDGYKGSGKWVRSIKDKSILDLEIISFHKNIEELKEIEKIKINECISDPLNMNFNNNSVGFSSGHLNPNSKIEMKPILRERILGDKNPAKRPEVRQKISNSLKMSDKQNSNKGKKLSKQACENISKGRKNIKYSKEGREKLSESRKLHYSINKRLPSFKGRKHTEETKRKIAEAALLRSQKKRLGIVT